MDEITGEETFGKVLSEHPRLAKVFFEHGMACAMCGLARTETIKQGAEAHGVKVDELLEELNEKLQEEKKKK